MTQVAILGPHGSGNLGPSFSSVDFNEEIVDGDLKYDDVEILSKEGWVELLRGVCG